MIFPYETEHYCDGLDGKKYLVSTLWVEILYTVGAIQKNPSGEDYPPNIDNIMEGIGCYDSEAILEFIEDLVKDGFLVENDDSWFLTEKGFEFYR